MRRQAAIAVAASMLFTFGCSDSEPNKNAPLAPQPPVSNAPTPGPAWTVDKPDAAPTPEQPTGPVAQDPIPELPDYPAGTRVAYADKGAEGPYTRVLEARMTTSDPVETVKEWYKKSFQENGWMPMAMRSANPDEILWSLSKGKIGATIEIRKNEQAGNTSIVLRRLER